MDMTRLILLYGVWIAVALIVAGIAVMVLSGRRHKWFVPRTVLGWFAALGGFILFGIGVFSLAVFVFIDVGAKGDALRAMERARGARAPELSFARLDGTSATLAELEGQVVLVNFWATWCPPCVEEMAVLDELQQAYADQGLVVLNLSDEEIGTVAAWLENNPMATLHGIVERAPPPASPFDAMNQARPVSFAIDRDGMIRDTAMGRMTREQFEKMVRPYL